MHKHMYTFLCLYQKVLSTGRNLNLPIYIAEIHIYAIRHMSWHMILFHCHSASENCSASIETTGAYTCSSFFCAAFVVCCGETRATAASVECLSKNLNMSVIALHWRCCLLISAEGCVSNFKMLLCTATKACVGASYWLLFQAWENGCGRGASKVSALIQQRTCKKSCSHDAKMQAARWKSTSCCSISQAGSAPVLSKAAAVQRYV